jgi:hypothetical protein
VLKKKKKRRKRKRKREKSKMGDVGMAELLPLGVGWL